MDIGSRNIIEVTTRNALFLDCNRIFLFIKTLFSSCRSSGQGAAGDFVGAEIGDVACDEVRSSGYVAVLVDGDFFVSAGGDTGGGVGEVAVASDV